VVVVQGGMSVINKMLQDLDRRQALGAGADSGAVRAPRARTGGHEWFWRIHVVLLAAALGWIGWVGYQLMPRKPLVTELAFQAAAEAQSRAKPVAPAPVALPELPKQEEPKAAAEAPAPVQVETLRLAVQLETPIAERQPAAPAPKPVAPKPKAKAAEPPQQAAVKVDRKPRTPADGAEAHFRRAALLLGSGRVSEAEAELAAALRLDPSHAPARQAYVSLLLEQRRVVGAEQLLQDGLALDPQQPAFALALARIHAGRREFKAALEVMDRAGPVTGNPDFHAMRAAVLQRLGRHGEAVDEYQGALNAGGQAPGTWIGFGISLEALGRKSEALLAYRRALAAGPIAQEAREYAEGRAKSLE
jgi:MSHA biogenesis protein MshN